MSDSPDRPDVPPRRRGRWALYLLLVASGLFAAWQIYVFASSVRRSAGPGALNAGVCKPAPGSPPATMPLDPLDVRGDPLGRMGLAPLEGDPGGIAPPPGARRLGARRRRADGQVWLEGRYDYDGTLDAAVEHYRRIAAARGLRGIGDREVRFGWRQVIFDGEEVLLRISLRKKPSDDKIVRLVVVVIEK